jgi:ABC-type multidrug transport system fused ATPase/permease subunit
MVNLGGTLQEVRGDMNRLDDVQQAVTDPYADTSTADAAVAGSTAVASNASNLPALADGAKLTGYLELRGVTFGYCRLEPPLVKNLSISLRPGSRVALVGGSGSGKSTIAKLACGLYEPWEGEVLFDGRRRADIPREVMARSFAAVDQDIFLFEGTLRDNLTLWDTTPARARVDTTRQQTRAAPTSAADSASGSRSRARSSPIRPSWCSTKRPARWTRRPSRRSTTVCAGAGARVSSSPIASARFATATRSSSSIAASSCSAARTTS